MLQAATGRDPLVFVCAHRRRSVAVEVVRPLLFLLPFQVAGFPPGGLGEATGVLRLGSEWGLRVDLAVVPVRLLPWVSLDVKEMEKISVSN